MRFENIMVIELNVMASIEILIEGGEIESSVELDRYSFAVVESLPPRSHREPSLWQTRFAEIGGVLVHLGEERFRHQTEGWFFAHDLLEEDNVHFRFKTKYYQEIVALLTALLERSKGKRLHFTSDVQFGPNPRIEAKEFTLAEFLAIHQKKGIRFNTCYIINGSSEKR